MEYERLKEYPKIELHCHLDGSLSPEFIRRRLEREIPVSELQVSKDCRNLAEYLEKFEIPLKCLQDREGLSEKRGGGKCKICGSAFCPFALTGTGTDRESDTGSSAGRFAERTGRVRCGLQCDCMCHAPSHRGAESKDAKGGEDIPGSRCLRGGFGR